MKKRRSVAAAGGRHRCAHIVLVGHPQILDGADGDGAEIGRADFPLPERPPRRRSPSTGRKAAAPSPYSSGKRYCRSAVQKWEEVTAIARRTVWESTSNEARSIPSAMVEQAP